MIYPAALHRILAKRGQSWNVVDFGETLSSVMLFLVLSACDYTDPGEPDSSPRSSRDRDCTKCRSTNA